MNDLRTLARFGQALAECHVALDARRFVAPEGGEKAFHRFFDAELRRPDSMLLIAEIDSNPVGYAFVRVEPASLVELREAGAWLHDIFVDPRVRARGVGRRLVEAALDAARDRGSTSLMLGVSPRNAAARALFERMRFRATMIEMRVELDD